jgi:hypothetical protein
MCDENVATSIEPVICEARTFSPNVDTTLQRERELICDYGIGQQFVDPLRVLTVPKVLERFEWDPEASTLGMGACCWSPERIQNSLSEMVTNYRTNGDTLSARTFTRLIELMRIETREQELADGRASGFDGLMMLNQSEAEWRVRWQILYPPARSDWMHYLEKVWSFERPAACSPGAFCNAGTCPRYLQSGVVNVDFDTESSSITEVRRLKAPPPPDWFHHDAQPDLSKNISSFSQPCVNDSTNLPTVIQVLFPDKSQLAESNASGIQSNASSEGVLRLCSEEASRDGEREDRWRRMASENDTDDGNASSKFSAAGNYIDFGPEGVIGAPAVAHVRQRLRVLYAPPSRKVATQIANALILAYQADEEDEDLELNQTSVTVEVEDDENGTTFVPMRRVPTRRLQQENGAPATSLLARFAPQQCMAGTFCNARANSSLGTEVCPPGQFCAPGAAEPEATPAGIFVSEAGSVRGSQCFPGQFAPSSSTAECYPAPAGSSCPDFGTTIPFICPPGTFREPPIGERRSTTISCEPCGPGTWSPWRGTPDFSSCEPCPGGRVCPIGTGNVSQGTTCPEGHICGEGTTPDNQTDTKCYDGFFCGSSTTPDSVWQYLCVTGFYCGEMTTFVNRYKFRCIVGFYCPRGTGFNPDLLRPLTPGVVYINKDQFYLTQIIAQYLVRQRMMDSQILLRQDQLRDAEMGLPPMEQSGVISRLEEWKQEFTEGRSDQLWAIRNVSDYTAQGGTESRQLSEIQSIDFLASVLLSAPPESRIPAASYTNKCTDHLPFLQGVGWPVPACAADDNDAAGTGPPCPPVTQLECLCMAPNASMMLDCFGAENGYPDPSCVNQIGQTDASCLDTTPYQDDFDLMAGHYLTYVQASLAEELSLRQAANEGSKTRCPFGTMTVEDGQGELQGCQKRSTVNYLQENLEMVVGRVNPINEELTSVNLTRSSGTLDNAEDFRPVFFAAAGSTYLITFDVRHLPPDMRYREDWRIKFLVNTTLDPTYDDPTECDRMLERLEVQPGRPEIVQRARRRGCLEVTLPREFEHASPDRQRYFTFTLHPRVDIEWRVEAQIINGMYLASRFMLIRTALVEYVEPQRAMLGTTRAFATEIRNDLRLVLPANMPMKSYPTDGSPQEIVQEAVLSWLPFAGDFELSMRHQWVNGFDEYRIPDKFAYFQNEPIQYMSQLPYFSNCRGYGVATPIWQILEQNAGCRWADNVLAVGELSLGAGAAGDTCDGTDLECILDEVPNVKMQTARWFEAPTGTLLFHVTKKSFEVSQFDGLGKPESQPVYLQMGVSQRGSLPKRVILLFQYWQFSPREKQIARVTAYYTDFEVEENLEDVNAGRELWRYNLSALYYPMTHFEVMVNFAFPTQFYFTAYIGLGITCTLMVFALWFYHRLMCRMRRPPALLDMRMFSHFLPPIFKGFGFAMASVLPPLLLGLGLIRGTILGQNLPFGVCGADQLEDECYLGMLDRVESSYQGENEVTSTNPWERRTGRTGTILAIMGGYATMAALKLLIPGNESAYYKRQDKNIRDMIEDMEDEMEEKDTRKSDDSEVFGKKKTEDEGPQIPPIFCTHLWKRSSLALAIYSNAIVQQCIFHVSYSDIFRENIYYLIIILHFLRTFIRILATNYMCDTLLVVPIHTMSRLTYVVVLLAAPTLFHFLVSYILVLGIQVIDRVYLGACEELVIEQITRAFRYLKSYYVWVLSKRRGGTDPNQEKDDKDSEDDVPAVPAKSKEDEQHDAHDGAEADTEYLINFATGLSVDSVGNLLAPIFFYMCSWLYEESRILSNYKIREENSFSYVFFYVTLLVFQFIIDVLSINTVELFHGWKVVDYLEHCHWRYHHRTADWKAKEKTYDETLVPHQRGVDQMCFSEQYYFVIILAAFGMMAWMFGMQVIFVNGWNIFDDPASPVVLAVGLGICRASHLMIKVTANFVRLWVVRTKNPHQMTSHNFFGQVAFSTFVDENAPPKAPPGSAHEGWPEPVPQDLQGMERFRTAFLLENQLWLQATFAELRDNTRITQHRKSILEELSSLLDEIAPSKYAQVGDGEQGHPPELAFEFGAAPCLDIARAAGGVQRYTFEGSIAQELVRMWRARAQFVLLLSDVSSMVKLTGDGMGQRCELCGRKDQLVVTPIYTLQHLASLYRQQRDMSPLWNMPLWKHFYKTFTPTCTVCDKCQQEYYRLNQNIPVDEQRFKRLTAPPKTAHTIVMGSDLPLTAVDDSAAKLLRLWLAWTKDLVNNEEPPNFLPKYGFEGRTAAQIRRDQAEADRDAESFPSSSEDEEEKKRQEEEEAVQRRKEELEAQMEEPPPALRAPRNLTWSSHAVLSSWLGRARQNLQAPQLDNWERPMTDLPPPPPDPFLPGPPDLYG